VRLPEKGTWHHILVTFDGMLENVYVDGCLNTQTPITLFVEKGDILIGASGEPSENFAGYLAGLQLYDRSMTAQEVADLMHKTEPKKGLATHFDLK
jgi:xylan 1,4-beta-xylosidase